MSSRYLSPEPMLQDPKWVKSEARSGQSAPTYAYARNNPLKYTDPTGLFVWFLECPDIGGFQRGFSFARAPGSTIPQLAVQRTPGAVGLQNFRGTACEDLKVAEEVEARLTGIPEALLANGCWHDLVKMIREACVKERTTSPDCGRPPRPDDGNDPNYIPRGGDAWWAQQ